MVAFFVMICSAFVTRESCAAGLPPTTPLRGAES
jgi:hypothetical protein